MTAAHAKALVEALLAGGSTAEAIATAVKGFIAPEAKPIIDGLVAGGGSAHMVAATAKEFVDQLAAKRAKESRGRAERRARARLSADVRGQSADTVPANVPPTPPPRAFEARWPLGTGERPPYSLLLYTGQRGGDVVRMRRQDIVGGAISLVQEKTGT